MALPADEDIERLRRLANDRVAELIGRAKAAGQLRQEFASEDLLLLLVAHAAVVHVTREEAPAAGRSILGTSGTHRGADAYRAVAASLTDRRRVPL